MSFNQNHLGQHLTQSAAKVPLQNTVWGNLFCMWGGELWHQLLNHPKRKSNSCYLVVVVVSCSYGGSDKITSR